MEAKIKPQDLRIGNHVMYEKTTHVITGLLGTMCVSEWINANEAEPYHHEYNEIEPISLTEDILVRLGFEKDVILFTIKEDDEWKSPFTIQYDRDKNLFKLDFQGYWYQVKYVHQLQNLYYSLTGTELTPKPLNKMENLHPAAQVTAIICIAVCFIVFVYYVMYKSFK